MAVESPQRGGTTSADLKRTARPRLTRVN